jgi:hypothetical protein
MIVTIYFRIWLSSSVVTKDLDIKTYETIIIPVVLYGREAWSLTLREEHRLKVIKDLKIPLTHLYDCLFQLQ